MKRIIKFVCIICGIWLGFHTIVLLYIGLNDNPQRADVILILGNKIENDGVPSKRLQSRLDKGIELFNQGLANLIVVSGGIGSERFDEALIMKQYLVENGIPENAIITDSQGTNTYQTTNNLKKISVETKLDKVIVVTQYFHVMRAKLALSKFGFEYVYSSHAQVEPSLRDLYSIPREVIGYYMYLFYDYK